jgi:multiple sugar transport system substrate-binding protein
MKTTKLTVFIVVALFVFSSFGMLIGEGDKEEVKSEKAVPERFDGVVLHIALVSGFDYLHAILECLDEAAEELGANVEASWYSFDEQRDKMVMDHTGGNPVWDLVFSQTSTRGGWVESGLMIPLGKWIDEHPELVDEDLLALDDYYDISIQEYSYKGDWIGPPLMVTGIAMFYRADLFNDPIEKTDFKALYGYELRPAKTYDQFMEIAEFFTREKGELLAGKTLQADFFGTAHSNKPVGFLWYDFINYLIAFGADDIYDTNTMKPTFNSPEAITAGEYYVDLVPYLPPGHNSMASGQSTSMFAEGNVAMIIEFFARGMEMTLNPDKSKIADRVDFTVLPSVPGVKGRDHASVHIGNGISIYSLSKNKEAAYKVLELGFSERIMKKVFLDVGVEYGWIPPRKSVLSDRDVQIEEPIMKQVAEDLMEATDIFYFNTSTLPEYVNAMDICATALSKCLTGQAQVRTAFNDAQKELENLFRRAGLTK